MTQLNQPDSLSRRKFLSQGLSLATAFGLIGITGLSGCSRADEQAAQQAGNTLHFPKEIYEKFKHLTLNVATYKGAAASYFKEAGIQLPPYQVKYAELGGGNLTFEALNSGTVDIGPMSEIPPIFGIERKAPIKIIGVLSGDVNNQAIVVPEHSSIQSIQDLAGKRIGYIRSTTSHYLLLKVLDELGLGFKDIQPIALTPQDGFAAFQSHKLDAWAGVGYFIQLALQKANARILKTGQGYLSGNYVIAANQSSIADPVKHAAITDYILCEYQVWQWIQNNPEQWAAKTEQLMGIPKELFLQQFKNQSQPRVLQPVTEAAIASQQEVADTFYKAKVLQRRIEVRSAWDHSFNWESV